jgi:mono/diheme cytochrome c family protein
MKAGVVVGCVLCLTLTGYAQTQTAGNVSQPTPALIGDAGAGKTLFNAHQCFACHGYNGETGTRLLNEDGTFAPRLLTVRGFIAFIRAPRPNDRPPVGSSVSMPSYGINSLPEQQVAVLFAFIKTFKPTEPALRDIPLLAQMIREGGKVRK